MWGGNEEEEEEEEAMGREREGEAEPKTRANVKRSFANRATLSACPNPQTARLEPQGARPDPWPPRMAPLKEPARPNPNDAPPHCAMPPLNEPLRRSPTACSRGGTPPFEGRKRNG